MEDTEDAMQAIVSIRERTMEAENCGNAEFFASTCTHDVVVLPPGMPASV